MWVHSVQKAFLPNKPGELPARTLVLSTPFAFPGGPSPSPSPVLFLPAAGLPIRLCPRAAIFVGRIVTLEFDADDGRLTVGVRAVLDPNDERFV